MSEFDLPDMYAMHYRKAAEAAFAAKRPQRWAMEPVEAETHAAIMSAQFLGTLGDVACEFKHVASPCTTAVTHRALCCREPLNVCQSGRAWVDEKREDPWASCEDCGRPCEECWRLIPV